MRTLYILPHPYICLIRIDTLNVYDLRKGPCTDHFVQCNIFWHTENQPAAKCLQRKGERKGYALFCTQFFSCPNYWCREFFKGKDYFSPTVTTTDWTARVKIRTVATIYARTNRFIYWLKVSLINKWARLTVYRNATSSVTIFKTSVTVFHHTDLSAGK